MSYLVLARKYRPHNFEGVVGQSHVVQALTNALTQQRLHHAYLFTGTRGVGKTTMSRILAKSLNCTGLDGLGGITAKPCGVCAACRDIDAGRFVDYVELDAASNRGVEEISQLLDQAVYKPVAGRFKVYMIDEVHMLSNHAFNAMLKTLEEPPDYLKFVLATTDPQKVPPTVLSRCLHFNLRPMAPATVQVHLAQVLNNESMAAEAGALRLLSRAARGSMRDALSLTDQAIAYGSGNLTEEGVRQMLGAVDRTHCLSLLDSLAAKNGRALVDRCGSLREQGIPAAGVLEELAELCQQVAVFQTVPDALAEQSEDTQWLESVRKLSEQLKADELQLFYSMCLHTRAELHLAPDEYSGLLMLMLRMLAFRAQGPAGSGASAESPAPAEVSPRVTPTPEPVNVRKDTAEMAQAATLEEPAASVPSRVPATAALRQADTNVVSVSIPRSPSAQPSVLETVPRVSAGSQGKRASTSVGIPPWLDAPPDAEPDTRPAGPRIVVEPIAGGESSVPLSREVQASPSEARISPNSTPPGGGVASPDPLPVAQAEAVSMPVSERAIASEVPAAEATTASGEAQSEPLPVDRLSEQWAGLVRDLIRAERISALVRELAWNAQCIECERNVDGSVMRCVLRVDREMLRAQQHCDKLRTALTDHLGLTVDLRVDPGPTENTPALRFLAEKKRRQREAERVIQEDPLVRSVLETYPSARIVPGSIHPRSASA